MNNILKFWSLQTSTISKCFTIHHALVPEQLSNFITYCADGIESYSFEKFIAFKYQLDWIIKTHNKVVKRQPKIDLFTILSVCIFEKIQIVANGHWIDGKTNRIDWTNLPLAIALQQSSEQHSAWASIKLQSLISIEIVVVVITTKKN